MLQRLGFEQYKGGFWARTIHGRLSSRRIRYAQGKGKLERGGAVQMSVCGLNMQNACFATLAPIIIVIIVEKCVGHTLDHHCVIAPTSSSIPSIPTVRLFLHANVTPLKFVIGRKLCGNPGCILRTSRRFGLRDHVRFQSRKRSSFQGLVHRSICRR